jgi:hypothetical protein
MYLLRIKKQIPNIIFLKDHSKNFSKFPNVFSMNIFGNLKNI